MIIAMNSPYLGGAERSIIHQVSLIQGKDVKVLIPHLPNVDNSPLKELINEQLPNVEIVEIEYPQALFNASRSSSLFTNLLALFYLPFFALKCRRFLKEDIIWCNGNKIALPLYLAAKYFNFKGKFIWHFRDYPSLNRIYRRIWKMFGSEKFKFTCIGNSQDVERKIREVSINQVKTFCLYNPVGEGIAKKEIKKIKNIACASMLAPWKGLHDVINMAIIFEEELIQLGVENILIFGGQIYQTSGEHAHYPNEIKQLAKKSKLISFKGVCPPQSIYQDADLLIHSSIKEEPFGRILIEGFKANIPVISTALGGAGEIVINGESGLVYRPYHYSELFLNIKSMVINERLRNDLLAGASMKLDNIEKNMKENLKKIMEY